MSTEEATSLSSPKDIIPLIKQLIIEKHFNGITLLFQSTKNTDSLKEISSEVIHEICLVHLTDQIYCDNREMYLCAEKILMTVAEHGHSEECLLELLEIIEENKSDQVFTSALKALQIVLLRQRENRARSLEWSLNAIVIRIQDLPYPDLLKNAYDEKQEKLLELEEDIVKLLMNYITINMFYEPILKELTKEPRSLTVAFKSTEITRKNVLCCFLIQLLGKPFALLDLRRNERKTNTYTMQCAETLVESISTILIDPFFLLMFVEQRARWKRKYNDDKGVYEMSSNNIFLIEEKLPLDALAIYYYLVIVEEISIKQAPKVYSPLYIFEMCLYLVTELLSRTEAALQFRGLLLVQKTMENLTEMSISATDLEVPLHKIFCTNLCQMISYSENSRNRKIGVPLLRKYILLFDCEGRYLILENLLRKTSHSGIAGYLTTIYKDLVAAALKTQDDIPPQYSGPKFRSIMLQSICRLSNGSETDLLDSSDQLISALNSVRLFALMDTNNQTGFWDISTEIEKNFLQLLRTGLDLSVAHYQAECCRIKSGKVVDADEKANLVMLDISVINDDANDDAVKFPDLDRSTKLQILNRSLCTFDLMRSLLARASECLDNDSYSCARQEITGARGVTGNKFWVSNNANHRLHSSVHGIQRWPMCRYCSTTKITDTTNIDEFRKREQELEEDFNRKEREDVKQNDDEFFPFTNEEDKVKQAKFNAARVKILEAALLHVPSLGWSRNAIAQGAEDAGYPGVAHGMFPQAEFELVSYFYGKCNQEVIKRMREETENGEKKIEDPLNILVSAIRQRLEMITPYKNQWPQALALNALPQNVSTSLAQILTLVDDICYYSGDRSVEFPWYTRRIGLATIYKTTELYMLQDSSPDHMKTWEFLENRMSEAIQLEKMISQTNGLTKTVQKSFTSTFITARNILGIEYNRH